MFNPFTRLIIHLRNLRNKSPKYQRYLEDMRNPYNREEGQPIMPDGYTIDGRRLSGGSQQAFLEQKEAEARRRKAALDLAAESSLPEDLEILPSLRNYNIHVRSIIDGHIKECISLRDGSNGPEGQPGQERYNLVVARLQDIRVQLFGTPYDEPYEIVEDVILQTHQGILEAEIEEAELAKLSQPNPELDEDTEEDEEVDTVQTTPSLPSEQTQSAAESKLTNPPHGGSSVQPPRSQPARAPQPQYNKQKGRR